MANTLFLSLTLVLSLAGGAGAQARDPRLADLPPPIVELLRSEQRLMDTGGGDPTLIAKRTNLQNPAFQPQRQPIIHLKTYWVDESVFRAFGDDGFPKDLHDQFIRRQDGKVQYRLVVHPESENYYAKLLHGATRAEDFLGTPTASSRTLVVWKTGREAEPFFAKLSLDAKIGDVDRTLKSTEVSASVGMTAILKAASPHLPATAHFLPESFGIAPRHQDRGGMIIRPVPPEMLNGSATYVPMFALYADDPERGHPLLLRMAEKAGVDPRLFLRDRVIRPFVDQWLDLALQGITMEPHGQNLLIGIGQDGLPNGTFLHRDFGGFNVDLAYRRKMKYPTPAHLPVIHDLQAEYFQEAHASYLTSSLKVYFSASFLYAMDQKMKEWTAKGWAPPEGRLTSPAQFELKEEFESAFRRKTGTFCHLRYQMLEITKCIMTEREKTRAASPSETGCVRESVRESFLLAR